MDSPQIKHTNWNGFLHDKVKEKFGVSKYLGDIEGVSFYYSEHPDRSKGHKPIVLLTPEWINGMELEEFKRDYAISNGIVCKKCNEALYSAHRHDMHWCSGNHVAVDGGRSYTKITGNPEDYVLCKINLLEQTVTFENDK